MSSGMTKKINFKLLFFVSFCFYLSLLSFKTSHQQKIIKSFKDCLKNVANFYNKNPTKFFQEFRECLKIHIPISKSDMDNFANNVFEESKMFIPMVDDQKECIWLTIGIGGVETAERKFKEKYSQCKIYGVEPTNAGNFSAIGKVLPFGVGLKDELTELVVMAESGWKKQQMTVISLTNLLDNFIHSRFIEYLTIDIEGFEYKILESLVGNGIFADKKITFCQIDAELHNPKMPTAHSSIKKLNPVQFILNFLQDSSPYIPIFNVPYLAHPHQKVTFINIQDQRCENIFKFSRYFRTKK